MNQRLASLLLCIITAFAAQSQILDTSKTHTYKPLEVDRIEVEDILFLTLDSSAVDTGLNRFYDYYPTYGRLSPAIDLGLEASPILRLDETNENELNLNLGLSHMAPYFYDEKIHLYQTKRPFTRLSYSQGPNEMINIEVTHAQQISDRLTFGLNYRRIKNQSLYYSNVTNLSRVRMRSLFNTKFYTSYYTDNRKYEIVTSYVWNKSKNIETGGFVSDSLFNLLSGRDKIDNNEASFVGAYGILAQNTFKISQFYRPGGKSKDSTKDNSLSQFKSQFYLNTKLDNRRVEYEDILPDSNNYGINLAAFKDSIYHRTFSNEGGILITLKPLTLAASVTHAYNRIYMNGVTDAFNNVYLNGKGRLSIKQFAINAEARFGVLGYNLGDYHIKGRASTRYKQFNVQAGVLSQLVEPNFLENTLFSTAVQWSNTFSKVSVNQLFGDASIKLKDQTISGGIVAETSNGLIYYSGTNSIVQFNDFVTLLKTQVTYTVKKPHFGTDIKLVLQNSSNQQVLPRPNTSAFGNIYTQFRLFNKNLRVQLGAQTFWFSDFKSPTYNPYTRQWHNGTHNFSSYPPINLYTNARVKSFCFGIEFFHVQQGLMGNSYYSSPGYPLMPRSLRVNLRWDLNN